MLEDDPNSDYINANYLDVSQKIVKKCGSSCEMPSVARRLVVRQSRHGACYKRVYM